MSEPRMLRPWKKRRRWKTGCSVQMRAALRDEFQELLLLVDPVPS